MKIKICGIKDIDDLQYCISLGVDLIGLNFYSKSKRCVQNGNILERISTINLGNTKLVAVCVDNSTEEIDYIIQHYPISMIQFSGKQDTHFVEKFKDKAKIIYTIADQSHVEQCKDYCDIILFDASHGSGKIVDFQIHDIKHKFAIAGGICKDNIASFSEKYKNAEFLDIASGVEENGEFSKRKLEAILSTFHKNNFIHRSKGQFGIYGGAFIPETLKPIIDKISDAFEEFKSNSQIIDEFHRTLRDYAGRKTPLYFCENLTKHCNGAKIYAKREDLLHGGAHKTNNVIGQFMLAKMLDVKEVICETGAGQHGVAVAMVGAKFGIKVKVFMGYKDYERQKTNVERMRVFGADIIPVKSGSMSLKDAINEAMKYWVCNPEIYYVFGTAAGPHPFPQMVSYFQKIIGDEAREQILKAEKLLPSAVVACIGGGSNAIGIFQGFLGDTSIELIGVEPQGTGEKHGMSLQLGKVGCLHGSMQKVLCDENGNIQESHSISAGLDYPGVSPIHAFMFENKLSSYVGIHDYEAINAYTLFSQMEGIIPALETSHAIAHVMKIAKNYKKNEVILFNLSGRGDKDIETVANFTYA